MDGHHSMQIYMNAMKQCYLTLRKKFAARYGHTNLHMQEFSYFAFHTPFSKMVQKAFLALILADIEANFEELQANKSQARYPRELTEQLAASKFNINDNETMKLLLKKYGAEWQDKCERSLLLAKQLGNIYTGSLYNGLLSLICDDQIDLTGKQVCMFSYGSGCAASMFILRFNADYHRIRQLSDFKERLASRVKVAP